MTEADGEILRRTPLYALHQELGAKLVPFAGHAMPLHYAGILSEHNHARSKAVLFDVSHMGQAIIRGENAPAALERWCVADVNSMPAGKLRYSLLTNPNGGILDDFMIISGGYFLWLIVNAARKEFDFAHLTAGLADHGCTLQPLEDWALLAVQGPLAATVMARLAPASRMMLFMTSERLTIDGVTCGVSRSGYTGEDGFEIAVPAAEAEHIARLLLLQPEVAPAGLGARDTLRLEAGLCLYGNDIDETTTPIEADLAWTIGRRRREAGDFPGADVILRQLREGASRKRVGILLDGRAPARAGARILDADGAEIGRVTSGTLSPTLGQAVAMGYVSADRAEVNTPVRLVVRDRALAGKIVALPFVAHRYRR